MFTALAKCALKPELIKEHLGKIQEVVEGLSRSAPKEMQSNIAFWVNSLNSKLEVVLADRLREVLLQ